MYLTQYNYNNYILLLGHEYGLKHLLTKAEVKMAGIGQVFFFACFINIQNEQGQYPAILTEQA